ncbi:MAG: HEPN domain-containing protein [Caldisericia bacterium]
MNRYLDWYEQAKIDFEKAKYDLKQGYYEWCCFTAQQSGEKIVKALILKLGFSPWGHSITNLLKLLKEKIEIHEDIINKAQILDSYYIPTRYPNSFSEGKPSDYYNKKMAEEAIDAASEIIRFCENYLLK